MSVKCAVVGYGAAFNMGGNHCNAMRATDGLEVVGVYDIDPKRREAAKTEQEGATVYDSYEALLADPNVELVTLVTPHDTHAPLAIAASNAGKHVITEKAMCLSAKEADEMISAAKAAGKMLSVYQNRRWDRDFQTILKLKNEGVFGDIFQIDRTVNSYGAPFGWRAVKKHGGGMLYDWGAHLIDQLVQLMLPAKPKTVFANLHHAVWNVDTETQADVNILFDNGVLGTVDVGSISFINRPHWLVRGSKGAAQIDKWEGPARVRTQVGGMNADMQVDFAHADWQGFYENISDHLNNGADLLVKPEHVRINMLVIDAAFESARTGQSVNIG